ALIQNKFQTLLAIIFPMKQKIKKSLVVLSIVLASLLFLFILFDLLFPLDEKRLFKPLSSQVYDSNGELLRVKLSRDGYYRFKATSDEIPKLLKKSVLNFEDRYFYSHFGINPIALVKALIHNSNNERKVGASTITMQVARMMQRKKRTLGNKLSEIFTALQLEWHYSKDEILSFYFNLAPYGGNIDGIKTAAWFYYKKPLKALSIAQLATLTTVPKNPNANRIDKAKNLYAKRLRVLRILLKDKLIDKEQFDRAFKEPIIQAKRRVPFIAPHFTDLLPEKEKVNSSLDLDLQQALHKLLKEHVDSLLDFDLHNGSAIVIHNPTMQVKAYIGSDRFFNVKNFGQNDGAQMIRSPGSTLKPFIYAKALDQGLITPQRKIFDLPLHLKGYDPKNFNDRFEGITTASEALQNSLNIPAIELNRLLEDEGLYELLKASSLESLTEKKQYYGDALALGGFGISLLDLAHLYTSFANGGKLKSLVFTKEGESQVQAQLFSKEASYITTEILSDAVRPEFSSYWESTKDLARIAFKTGTSARSRDLYTIGVTPEYTIAIWMGNFSGDKTKDLTGMSTASRLLFEITHWLQNRESLAWFEKPEKVALKEVCSDALIQGSCKEYEEDLTIKGVTLQRPCKLLRAEVLSYLKSSKLLTQKELELHNCYETWKNYPPLITSLYDGQTIIYNKEDLKKTHKVMLKCYTFKDDPKLFWLIDGQTPLESQSESELYEALSNGSHTLGCLDSQSTLSEITLTIKEE
ncbi:MAG: penicillin-binding protein 1C, partial [Thiovulaceae bacterium]|nr:penicillin-binding protein 1C [Sulfurimonadaceae bacterium]